MPENDFNLNPPPKRFPFRLIGYIFITAAISVTMAYFLARLFSRGYTKMDKDRLSIEIHRRYTIATTTNASYTRNHNADETFINYFYYLNGRKIYDNFQAHLIYKVPARYYLIFSSEDYRQNRVLPIEVPDSITNAPDEGWKSIPGARFTVGRVEKTEEFKAYINFNYKQHFYEGYVFEDFLTKVDIGKKYYISFAPSNPEYGLSIYLSPMFDSTKQSTSIPVEGMISLPFN